MLVGVVVRVVAWGVRWVAVDAGAAKRSFTIIPIDAAARLISS